MRRSIAACFLMSLSAAVAAAPAGAQLYRDGDSGPREILPRAEEIALARSAAPSEISGDATVFVLAAGGYERAVEGDGGVACFVSRAWRASLEPICYDPEGARTVMRISMRRVELLHAGRTVAEANEEIAAALLDGDLRLPSRPVLSWMMSSGQRLVNSEGTSIGAWKPHVMVYSPYLDAGQLGLDGPPARPVHALLASGGTALSNLVVVVPEFVEPARTESRAAGAP